MSLVRVAIDAMGGDQAPTEIVAGALSARSPEIDPILYGLADVLEPMADGLEVVHAPTVVGMEEKPTDAAREKRDSSLFAACRAVGNGEADVVISAGNTGAVLAAGLLEIRRMPDVYRPAIAAALPAARGPSVLIDAGANADARPEHLVQFAEMGTIFAEEILEISDPEVGLLSIGSEPEKGNRLVRDTYALLEASDARFIGNVESAGLLDGVADVVVCDGFTGNIALKTLEGTIKTVLTSLHAEVRASLRGKVGGLLIRPAQDRLRECLNPETYGGGYLLGLSRLAVIAHGNSSGRAMASAIRLGALGVRNDVVHRLHSRLSQAVEVDVKST